MQAQCDRAAPQGGLLSPIPPDFLPRPGQCVVAGGSSLLSWAQRRSASNVWLHNIFWQGTGASAGLVDWSPSAPASQLWVTDCTFTLSGVGLRAGGRVYAAGVCSCLSCFACTEMRNSRSLSLTFMPETNVLAMLCWQLPSPVAFHAVTALQCGGCAC